MQLKSQVSIPDPDQRIGDLVVGQLAAEEMLLHLIVEHALLKTGKAFSFAGEVAQILLGPPFGVQQGSAGLPVVGVQLLALQVRAH